MLNTQGIWEASKERAYNSCAAGDALDSFIIKCVVWHDHCSLRQAAHQRHLRHQENNFVLECSQNNGRRKIIKSGSDISMFAGCY